MDWSGWCLTSRFIAGASFVTFLGGEGANNCDQNSLNNGLIVIETAFYVYRIEKAVNLPAQITNSCAQITNWRTQSTNLCVLIHDHVIIICVFRLVFH